MALDEIGEFSVRISHHDVEIELLPLSKVVFMLSHCENRGMGTILQTKELRHGGWCSQSPHLLEADRAGI